jgi:dihydroceramide fatty acyl 2-hydroxylase
MRALKASRQSRSERMFESDLFEFFSRIPPWQPPAIFLPMIGWQVHRAHEVGTGASLGLGLFLGGLVTWTLLEYWLHRLLFHYEATTAFGKRFIWLTHGVHHDWPNDKLRLVFPPAISLPLAALFFWLFDLALGPAHRYAAFAGLLVGYLSYDMLHYYVHHFAPRNRALRYLRRYHLEHHFRHEPLRFGVSLPVWDFVFGTAPRVDREGERAVNAG